MKLNNYMPAIFTNLGGYFTNHATPEMATKAKSISAKAAFQIGVAMLLYCFFMKMREKDETNPTGDIPRETLSVCTCALIAPGATTLSQQAKLMMKGFDSIKNGWQKKNNQQLTRGLALIGVTYITATNLFANSSGIEGFFGKT